MRRPAADRAAPPSHSEWIARTVPGAIVRRSDLRHFGHPDADLVERLSWLTGAPPAARAHSGV
jgi:hypothetical protein